MTQPADRFATAPESPLQAEIEAFFAASEAYMARLYPAESNHFAPAETLAQDNVIFLVVRDEASSGRPARACGAVVLGRAGDAPGDSPETGEIKRMWVDPQARGHGLGRRMLRELEARAATRGARVLRLETGIHQPEAIALYRACGYGERPPFASYQPDPLSLFMEKWLPAAG